ncbi:MAG: hypothetical protein O3B01_26065 [Planctomycetota bacterium]|nr:hypothetical protein [Planctomycetota bacterium]
MLDVFDRYNFTVNEAEPLEKEVAIDPEMLGKVFENLIEDNRRKGLGAFYTPREIVHYMCQESLINYLDTAVNTQGESFMEAEPGPGELFGTSEKIAVRFKDQEALVPRADIETFIHLGEEISHYEAVDAKYPIRMPKSIQENARLIDDKLAEITVCDPAVGSGAFPVGMMTEIVRARCALTPYFNDVHERTPTTSNVWPFKIAFTGWTLIPARWRSPSSASGFRWWWTRRTCNRSNRCRTSITRLWWATHSSELRRRFPTL